MRTLNAENELKQHLIRQQMMFVGPRTVENRLRKLMGKARYEGYLDISDEYQAGSVSIDSLYQQMQTLEEANALMSHQAQATLIAGEALYNACRPYLFPGMHACELGCYTGGLASWFAERHPGCMIVGVDRQAHILELASRASSPKNLIYRRWDYTCPPMASEEFDLLWSCFGVDLGLLGRSDYYSLDPHDRRFSEGYQRVRRTTETVLAIWRAAAKTGSRLFTALRISSYDDCLAVVDSAAATGWKLGYKDSFKSSLTTRCFRS